MEAFAERRQFKNALAHTRKHAHFPARAHNSHLKSAAWPYATTGLSALTFLGQEAHGCGNRPYGSEATFRKTSSIWNSQRAAGRPAGWLGGPAQANCCSDSVVQLELHPTWAQVSLRRDCEKVPPRRSPVSSGGYKLWSVERLEHRVCDLLCCVHICPEQDHKQIIIACFRLQPGAVVVCHFRGWSCARATGRRWCTAGLWDLSIMSASVITVTLTRTFRNALLSHLATQSWTRHVVCAFFKSLFFAEIIVHIWVMIKICCRACSLFLCGN